MRHLKHYPPEVQWSRFKLSGVTHAFKPYGRRAYCGRVEVASKREWKKATAGERESGLCLACYRAVHYPTHTLAILGVY